MSGPAPPRAGPRLADLAPAILGVALSGLALLLSRRYAVDWFYDDDIATLRWFAAADEGRLSPAGVLGLWNNEHPVGAQFALLWAARGVLGLDMRAFVGLSVGLVAGTAALSARLAAGPGEPLAVRLAAVAACFALAFQPTQTEHLLWSFEVGWFAVNAVVVADAALAERFGPRAALPSALLCAAASLCSAQGSLAFFAAAAHQALMPARRGRAAAAGLLALGGAAAVARLLWEVHPSPSAPVRPDSDLLGMLSYAVELVGAVCGGRSPGALLGTGAALVALAALLAALRRGGPRPDRRRVALVLMGFSGLCVAAFARGRHHLGLDWATASFHAAPLLVPLLLGFAVLLGAPPPRATPRRLDAAAAGAAGLLLAATTAAAWPYGAARARLWSMDLGYARWAACSGEVPDAVAALGSGVDLASFAALRPRYAPLCRGAATAGEAALLRRPPLFDALAARNPAAGAALDGLWQAYATDLALQRAFKAWAADTPERLVRFAASASAADLGRLAPFAADLRALATAPAGESSLVRGGAGDYLAGDGGRDGGADHRGPPP